MIHVYCLYRRQRIFNFFHHSWNSTIFFYSYEIARQTLYLWFYNFLYINFAVYRFLSLHLHTKNMWISHETDVPHDRYWSSSWVSWRYQITWILMADDLRYLKNLLGDGVRPPCSWSTFFKFFTNELHLIYFKSFFSRDIFVEKPIFKFKLKYVIKYTHKTSSYVYRKSYNQRTNQWSNERTIYYSVCVRMCAHTISVK